MLRYACKYVNVKQVENHHADSVQYCKKSNSSLGYLVVSGDLPPQRWMRILKAGAGKGYLRWPAVCRSIRTLPTR